jgi:S1-C subfamily serine protease
VQLWEEMRSALNESWVPKSPVTITVKRGEGSSQGEKSFTLVFPNKPTADKGVPFAEMDALGMHPSELFVLKVNPGSPAEKGGLLPGDRVVKVGSVATFNFETIVDQVQQAGAARGPLLFEVEREGKMVTASQG